MLRLLVLLIVVLSSWPAAAEVHPFGTQTCGANIGTWRPPSYSPGNKEDHDAVKPRGMQDCREKMPAMLEECQAAHPNASCFAKVVRDIYGEQIDGNYVTAYNEQPYYSDSLCASPLVPDPDTGECVPPPCPAPGILDDDGYCHDPAEPEDCQENGQYYDQGGYCVNTCASGSALDHYCLENPDPECSSASDDFVGTIGYGGKQKAVCGDNSCPKGGTFGFSESAAGNYTATCFPEDSNPPQCSSGAALIVGEGGYAFRCDNVSDKDSDGDGIPDSEEDSNGDSDGDGEGDLTGVTNQLDDIKKLLKTGNNDRTGLKSKLDQLNKTIGDGVNTLKDAIGNIPGGGNGGDGGSGGDGGDGDGGDGGSGEGEGEDPITWTGEPIDTELTAADEEYEAVMQEYQDTLTNLKNEVQNMFGANLSGGGSVPDDVKQIKGVDVNFSLNRFLGGFEILPALILFIAAFISLGIITSGRG